jgi:hypothetical protein
VNRSLKIDMVFGGVLVLVIVIAVLFPMKAVKIQDVGPTLVFVSGTEYNIGEAGQVIVEARYKNGSSALVGLCLMTIWYPDKSLFLTQNALVESNGNQYVNFTVPNMTGVYEYQSNCSIGVVSKSFHVSEFQNETTEKLLRRIKAVTTK